jgi:HAD superfamily hydrolase (TIGR01509 family)
MTLPRLNLPRLPGAVVFDMDGLLFDTEALYEEAIAAAAAERGREMPPAVFRRMLGNPWPTNREILLAHFGADFAVDALREAWVRRFEVMVETRLALKPGAAELLDTLDALGLPRAIATSSQRSNVEHHLAFHGLTGRFHAIAAAGDYVRGKPAPDPFLKAAERLGIAPERCLALEDSHNGVRSAAAAGMMTVMVPDLLEPDDEVRGLCLHVARSLLEVRDALLEAAR